MSNSRQKRKVSKKVMVEKPNYRLFLFLMVLIPSLLISIGLVVYKIDQLDAPNSSHSKSTDSKQVDETNFRQEFISQLNTKRSEISITSLQVSENLNLLSKKLIETGPTEDNAKKLIIESGIDFKLYYASWGVTSSPAELVTYLTGNIKIKDQVFSKELINIGFAAKPLIGGNYQYAYYQIAPLENSEQTSGNNPSTLTSYPLTTDEYCYTNTLFYQTKYEDDFSLPIGQTQSTGGVNGSERVCYKNGLRVSRTVLTYPVDRVVKWGQSTSTITQPQPTTSNPTPRTYQQAASYCSGNGVPYDSSAWDVCISAYLNQ